MTPEMIAVIGVGIALAATILHTNRETNRSLNELLRDVADLRERMARLEGLFEGFTGRRPTDAPG